MNMLVIWTEYLEVVVWGWEAVVIMEMIPVV